MLAGLSLEQVRDDLVCTAVHATWYVATRLKARTTSASAVAPGADDGLSEPGMDVPDAPVDPRLTELVPSG